MNMTFDDPSDGTELMRVVKGSTAPTAAEVRFDPPSSNETLSGQPSSWCNEPSAGQPLIFQVPVPNLGEPDTTGDLEVTQRLSGTIVRIPIRIRRDQ